MVLSEQEEMETDREGKSVLLYPYPLLGSLCNENRTQQSGWDCRCFPSISGDTVLDICSAREPNEQGRPREAT